MSRKQDLIDNLADVLIQMADDLTHLRDCKSIHLDNKPGYYLQSGNRFSTPPFSCRGGKSATLSLS